VPQSCVEDVRHVFHTSQQMWRETLKSFTDAANSLARERAQLRQQLSREQLAARCVAKMRQTTMW